MSWLAGITLTVGMMSVAVAANAAPGASDEKCAPDQKLVTAAQQEGVVYVYGDHVHVPPLIEGFTKKYKGIRVNFVGLGGWDTYYRYLDEAKAGRTIADVLYSGDDAIQTASDAHNLATMSTASAPCLPAWAIRDGGSYFRVHGVLAGILYNSSALKGLPVPKDWSDFIHPPAAWQHLVIFADPRNSSQSFEDLAALYQNFGPEWLTGFMKGLHSIDTVVANNPGAQESQLMSGERPITPTLHSGYYGDMIARGAPMVEVLPPSGTIAQFVGIAVTKDAPHPAAARLFVDYSLSPEGQAILVNSGAYGVGIGAPYPKDQPAFSTAKILPYDVAKALRERDAIIHLWQEAFGIY